MVKDQKIDLDGSSDEAEETDHKEDINVNSKKVRLLLSLFLTILFVSNIDLTFISTSIRQQQTTKPRYVSFLLCSNGRQRTVIFLEEYSFHLILMFPYFHLVCFSESKESN